jgi:hypothetical protein
MTQEPKKITKSLILVKATTIALGIVLVVLMMVLLIVSQKEPKQKANNCAEFLQINITGEVEQMTIDGKHITILTKKNQKNKTQEIIKIDSNCAKIINHIKFNVL